MEIRDESNKWIDSSVFRKEAIKFIKNETYCPSPVRSPDWFSYWDEQLDRCKNGYAITDKYGRTHKITGHHYFYLNFTQIEIVEQIKGSKASKKITQQPDFWDGDYDYFWSLEIAKNGLYNPESQVITSQAERDEFQKYNTLMEDIKDEEPKKYEVNPNYISYKEKRDAVSIKILKRLGLKVRIHLDYLNGGFHMIVGKARRKGYSFKDGAICANIYNTERKAQIIIGAFESKFLYPKGTMGMASDYLNFLNEHTAWTKSRDYTDKVNHRKASYRSTTNGVTIEKGYQSEIFAITFKDNPDAARGKDGKIVLLEEAGAFPNLKDSFAAIVPALTAGAYITGQIVIFGTGGDMDSGTVDFADMFYNPELYGLLPFINIWDDQAENSTCGFFHPVIWNMEGYYDEMGNSDLEGATKFENNRRNSILAKSNSTTALNKHTQEFPFKPAEAFLTVSSNSFPVVELRRQLDKVIVNKLQMKKATPVELSYDKGKVKATPILDGSADPITSFKPKTTNLAGCVMIYEYPPEKPPYKLYKIGYDPYRQNNGSSLGAIYVYKSTQVGSSVKNQIVAEYIGRPAEADMVTRISLMLAELYNTEVMYENEVTHVVGYFKNHGKLSRLAAQPDDVISANIKNSKVSRVYGMHMNEKLKDAGEKYIATWLTTVRGFDEDGNPILNLETIYSEGLLEELIRYNRKGNFDRVMAFMQCMFQEEQDGFDKEYAEHGKVASSTEDMLNFFMSLK